MENGGGFMSWVSTSSNSCSTHQLVDPTVLKVSTRQYYPAAAASGEEEGAASAGAVKREKISAAPSNGMIPRCQVEGCHKSLADAKDYHKRHKVCAIHAKAPKVVVLGTEQRFCQQCSRFHAILEFDDTKRSCRRRLAEHNERRRKSNSDSNRSRNPLALETTIMGSRFQYLSERSPGRALSLLSSSPELSSRSNAAPRELIAENRAALLARQLSANNGMWHNNVGSYNNQSINISFAAHQNQEISAQCPTSQFLNGCNRLQEPGNDHLTLDLMQTTTPNCTSFVFNILGGNKSKEEEEECCEIWNSLEGTHVV